MGTGLQQMGIFYHQEQKRKILPKLSWMLEYLGAGCPIVSKEEQEEVTGACPNSDLDWKWGH